MQLAFVNGYKINMTYIWSKLWYCAVSIIFVLQNKSSDTFLFASNLTALSKYEKYMNLAVNDEFSIKPHIYFPNCNKHL